MGKLLQGVEPDEARGALQGVDGAEHAVELFPVLGLFLQGEQAFLPFPELVARFFAEYRQVLGLDFHAGVSVFRFASPGLCLGQQAVRPSSVSWRVSFSSTAMLISMGPYWVMSPRTSAGFGTRCTLRFVPAAMAGVVMFRIWSRLWFSRDVALPVIMLATSPRQSRNMIFFSCGDLPSSILSTSRSASCAVEAVDDLPGQESVDPDDDGDPEGGLDLFLVGQVPAAHFDAGDLRDHAHGRLDKGVHVLGVDFYHGFFLLSS